ncbi:MAG: DUF1080 domain-containing protein [Planctomycetes bacterium]|nr:DUF1080 domain-containing protein [Planctomycetota bacterium]
MAYAPSKIHALSSALVVGLLLCLPAAGQTATQQKAKSKIPPGFSALFNGKDLSGWRGRPHLDPSKEAAMEKQQLAAQQKAWDADVAQHWRVENGEIINDGHGAFLTTNESFGDMELWLDYRTVAQADSGIYLRATPQVQIWDTTEAGGKWNIGADKGSGGLWNNQKHARHPLKLADKPFGEWNRMRIVMLGEHVSVWLNGQQTVDHTPLENFWDRSKPLAARGPVQLQTHGGEIRFRNIFVKRFTDIEANQLLAKQQAKEFHSIFNGNDFEGWTGAVDNYEVVDGTVRCKAGAGGNLFTTKTYADFVVRFEFKLPPGGNNGLAIRYPGTGNPAYDAMCELQVLENTHPKYANLKEYQFHGSIYGQHPAHRGYLREVGKWNFQEVRVQGSLIHVVLNGTTILHQDVSQLGDPIDGQKHPGKTLTSGHFGFAGHNDPVQFRNIQMRNL